MISPIRTVFVNNSDRSFVFRVTNHMSVVLNPKGTASIPGDVFTWMRTDAEAVSLLNIIKTGNVSVHYTLDSAFATQEAVDMNMAIPHGAVRDWYMSILKPAAKPAVSVDKPVETVKQQDKKVEEAPAVEEEPKETETATVESVPPVKDEQPTSTPVKEEEAPEHSKPTEEAPKAAKPGRKIKVQ